jgi:hypothetical protein
MMKTALYPGKFNSNVGIAMVVGLAGWASYHWFDVLNAISPSSPNLAFILSVAAGVVAWKNTMPLLRKTPTFDARADGFSVMGGPLQSWESFQGVRATQMRIGLLPMPTDLKISVKRRGPIAKKISIPFTLLPASPEASIDMIQKLAARGQAGQIGHATGEAVRDVLTQQVAQIWSDIATKKPAHEAAAPRRERPAPTKQPTRTTQLRPVSDGGPIKTKRRLFASKVI